MLSPIDNYFLQKQEPIRSCLQYLRDHILSYDPHMSEAWKYSMPFYFYKGKRFGYLWVHKQYNQPYIGIVEGRKIEHPELLLEKRAKMKILLVNPHQDIDLHTINTILLAALDL